MKESMSHPFSDLGGCPIYLSGGKDAKTNICIDNLLTTGSHPNKAGFATIEKITQTQQLHLFFVEQLAIYAKAP